ncbi:MAG: hypothetical protein IT289_10640 [Oligoflexia bacterium]|nr:hypothetical protein [Oligoflexia bacterium]
MNMRPLISALFVTMVFSFSLLSPKANASAGEQFLLEKAILELKNKEQTYIQFGKGFGSLAETSNQDLQRQIQIQQKTKLVTTVASAIATFTMGGVGVVWSAGASEGVFGFVVVGGLYSLLGFTTAPIINELLSTQPGSEDLPLEALREKSSYLGKLVSEMNKVPDELLKHRNQVESQLRPIIQKMEGANDLANMMNNAEIRRAYYTKTLFEYLRDWHFLVAEVYRLRAIEFEALLKKLS